MKRYTCFETLLCRFETGAAKLYLSINLSPLIIFSFLLHFHISPSIESHHFLSLSSLFPDAQDNKSSLLSFIQKKSPYLFDLSQIQISPSSPSYKSKNPLLTRKDNSSHRVVMISMNLYQFSVFLMTYMHKKMRGSWFSIKNEKIRIC